MTLAEFVANPWIGLLGILIGIVSIFVSIALHMRGRKYKQPAFYKSTLKWYDGTNIPHKDIKLLFRGRPISRFAITNMAFWNDGNQTIVEGDFAPAEPLALKILEGVELFDIRVTAVTSDAINVYLNITEKDKSEGTKVIPIRFDYLDKNDGFLVQLIHDAKSDEEIAFSGKILGVSAFKSSNLYSMDRVRLPSQIIGPRIPFSAPLFKWVYIPLTCIGIGFIGIWSVYCSIVGPFHWYQILGWLLIVYLFVPFSLFSDFTPPKALVGGGKPSD